jgi:hypothetical protein
MYVVLAVMGQQRQLSGGFLRNSETSWSDPHRFHWQALQISCNSFAFALWTVRVWEHCLRALRGCGLSRGRVQRHADILVWQQGHVFAAYCSGPTAIHVAVCMLKAIAKLASNEVTGHRKQAHLPGARLTPPMTLPAVGYWWLQPTSAPVNTNCGRRLAGSAQVVVLAF